MEKKFLTSEDIAEIEFQIEASTDRRCEAIAHTPLGVDIAILFRGEYFDEIDFIATIVLSKDGLLLVNLYQIHGKKTKSLIDKIHRALKDAII